MTFHIRKVFWFGTSCATSSMHPGAGIADSTWARRTVSVIETVYVGLLAPLHHL